MKTTALVFLLVIPAIISAQVRVDNAVQLEGATQQDRQLHGLAESALPGAVLTAGIEGSGAHRFASAASGPLWFVDLPSLTSAPVEGLHLLVRSDGDAEGPLALQLNGNGPYPITRGPATPVLAEEVPAGTVVSLVFDGASFQLMNGTTHRRRDCPEPMIAVNTQFCIEPVERDTVEFYTAALTCAQAGYRLCTWGEFIVACENAAVLGLQQMTGNYEWTNNAANEDGNVRIAGSLDCRQAAVSLSTGVGRNYRCCSTR